MIIGDYKELQINPNMVHGTEVWACGFELANKQKASKLLKSPPVLGKIMISYYESTNDKYTGTGVSYFIPYKKNKTELAYSKAVTLSARMYATTERECILMYNRAINDYIDYYKKCINDLQQELLEYNTDIAQ